MSERFDFSQAYALGQSVIIAADRLEVLNGQMEKRFGELGEYFRDGGYDEYSLDMTEANKSISEVMAQMKSVAKAILDYAKELEAVQ